METPPRYPIIGLHLINKNWTGKIPVQSCLIVGGLNKSGSLNFTIPSILASSLLLLDEQINGDNNYSAVNNAKYI
jgi:hypothetical protein